MRWHPLQNKNETVFVSINYCEKQKMEKKMAFSFQISMRRGAPNLVFQSVRQVFSFGFTKTNAITHEDNWVLPAPASDSSRGNMWAKNKITFKKRHQIIKWRKLKIKNDKNKNYLHFKWHGIQKRRLAPPGNTWVKYLLMVFWNQWVLLWVWQWYLLNSQLYLKFTKSWSWTNKLIQQIIIMIFFSGR